MAADFQKRKGCDPWFAAFVAKASGLLAKPAVCAVDNKYPIATDFPKARTACAGGVIVLCITRYCHPLTRAVLPVLG